MSNSTPQAMAAQLGMSAGAAGGKLRKMVLLNLLQRLGEANCHRCGDAILESADLSLDHIKPWRGGDTALYWDLDNIAFSHFSCNSGARRGVPKPFCPHDHDISVVGRDGTDHCRECQRSKIRKMREHASAGAGTPPGL